MRNLLAVGRAIAPILALFFAAVFGSAQTNEGQLSGTVLDSSGASVGEATISAKNEATGFTYKATSSSTGGYRFPSIQLGRYTVTTTAPGFEPVANTGVEVRVGTVTALDIKLAVGNTSETITVASNAPTVETQSSEVGGTVSTQQIVDLPLALGGVGAMRSPEAFVFLIPGTAGPGTANNNNGIFVSKIGGGQNFGNEVLLDGASQTRSENGSSFDEEAPSVEAISEFKVTTNTPAAEFGRTTGGIENFVTKSGTNTYHGTAYDIFRNDDLDANDWFNNGRQAYYKSTGDTVDYANNARGNDKQNDYGGSLGGPVHIPHIYNGRDKTFFFFAWEQFQQNLGGVAISTVPTVAERGGDLSDQLLGPNNAVNPCDGTPILNGEIFDPSTTQTVNGVQCRLPFRDPATGKLNQIPTSRFSPLAQKLLAYYPQPTNGALNNNYSLNSSSPINNTTYTIRIDQSLGAKNKIYGSYSTRENTRHNPTNLTLPAPVDPNVQTQNFITHFGRAGWDYVFTPTLLNHLNIGTNRSNSINGSIEATSGINYAKQLGIPNIQTGFPRINVTGEQSLSRNQLGDNIDNGIRFNDSVSWQKGRNSFKFGFDYRYQQYSALAEDQVNGYFNFNGNQTKASKTGAFQNGTGLGLASFLLGAFDSAGTTIPSHQPRWISNYWAGFVQDDLKVTNELVLNIGFRYDVDQPRREAENNTSNFSPTVIDPKSGIPGALVFGTNCKCNTRWADTWFKDFAPRIGFAYSPKSWDGRLAIRGGFSTLYGPLQYSDFGGATLTGYTNPINQNSDGFDASYQIDNGLNPYTVGTNLDPGYYDSKDSSRPNNFSNWIKPSYGRPAQVNQWNLQIQQELAKDLIFTLGYIGSAGSHLKSQEENVNNISPSTFGLGDILTQPFSAAAPAQGSALPYPSFNTAAQYFQALRPFPQYDFIATDCCLQNVGHSSYEALVASVERRFSQGLNLQASYTWAKSITNADSIINVTNGVQQEQDPNNSKSQKSLSNQDIPHTLVTSYIYQLPFGRNKHFLGSSKGIVNSMISGFEIGAVQRYQSGQPTSFGCADGIPGYQNCISFTRIPGSSLLSKARRGHIDPFRELRAGPNLFDGPDPNVDSEYNGLLRLDDLPSADHPRPYSSYQTAPAFISQNETAWRIQRAKQVGPGTCVTCDNGGFAFGNVPRVSGDARNYLYNNEDFSFIKRTPIHEGANFILKVELLNAFNRHIFGTPSINPGDRYFGVPTYTIDGPRKMQLTARIEF